MSFSTAHQIWHTVFHELQNGFGKIPFNNGVKSRVNDHHTDVALNERMQESVDNIVQLAIGVDPSGIAFSLFRQTRFLDRFFKQEMGDGGKAWSPSVMWSEGLPWR
jgi:hypothetical protein